MVHSTSRRLQLVRSCFIVCSVQMNACLKGHPIWRSFGTDQQEITSGTVRLSDVVLIEKAWCIVVLEGYSRCEVGFTVCSVQMNAFLKWHPIWRSFGIEQQAIMFRKSATEEEKNVLIIERERRECSGCLVHRGSEKEERNCEVVRSRNFVTLLLNIIKMKFSWT